MEDKRRNDKSCPHTMMQAVGIAMNELAMVVKEGEEEGDGFKWAYNVA